MAYTDEEILKNYERWCTDSYFDEDTRAELLAIEGDEKEIRERFYTDLSFGTGGMRGIMGAGTNRMNVYTVGKAAQGLANLIKKENGCGRGAVIAHDSRHMSRELAEAAALCLAANCIRVYMFDSLRPTPELSFAVRHLGCIAGAVVTASHNPAEYNGFKVYWEDGAQITYPKDEEIMAEISAVKSLGDVRTTTAAEAEAAGLYAVIGAETDDRYIEAVKSLVLEPEAVKKEAENLRIVYTPLHGTGNIPVRRILGELGFENVYVVPEQEKPDGAFPTVSSPNPEDPGAFRLALELAEKTDADLVLATDPDADRLGVYAKDRDGRYKPFTGNMIGALLCAYRLGRLREKGMLPENGAVVTTIVSGRLGRRIARDMGADVIETLTGFKYIGEQIKRFEEDGSHEFLFGYEESYGCLAGTYARDKDAAAAVTMLCEAAAYYRERGSSLPEQLRELYERCGFYKEELYTVTMSGIEGAAQIRAVMDRVRSDPPKRIGGYETEVFCDYLKDIRIAGGEASQTGLPRSNVLYFGMPEDTWCCIRPSGTEPKIKLYMGVRGDSPEEAEEKLGRFKKAVLGLLSPPGV